MTKTITFNALRRIKDALPSGSMELIAKELGIEKETVKNYFGGHDYDDGKSVGLHIEKGPDGGLVQLDDTKILNVAKRILGELNINIDDIVSGIKDGIKDELKDKLKDSGLADGIKGAGKIFGL